MYERYIGMTVLRSAVNGPKLRKIFGSCPRVTETLASENEHELKKK